MRDGSVQQVLPFILYWHSAPHDPNSPSVGSVPPKFDTALQLRRPPPARSPASSFPRQLVLRQLGGGRSYWQGGSLEAGCKHAMNIWWTLWLSAAQSRQHPGKHGTWSQCLVDVGPPSTTLVQHRPNIGSVSRVYEILVGCTVADERLGDK